MIVRKYDLNQEKYIEVNAIGIIKYIGVSFGIESLTNEKNYYVISIEKDMFRIIDDSEEDYLYYIHRPSSLTDISKGGKWELVEDDEQGSIKNSIEKYG